MIKLQKIPRKTQPNQIWSGGGFSRKSIQIAELEDPSPCCHSEAADPVNVDEDNSNYETESASTSSWSETPEETAKENYP